jgi:hypothetical protein
MGSLSSNKRVGDFAAASHRVRRPAVLRLTYTVAGATDVGDSQPDGERWF